MEIEITVKLDDTRSLTLSLDEAKELVERLGTITVQTTFIPSVWYPSIKPPLGTIMTAPKWGDNYTVTLGSDPYIADSLGFSTVYVG